MATKDQKKKKRKTRLKGTETHKPCVDCGKMKDRFKAFKPRWAGCVSHRSDRGRRIFEPGCDDCAKLVNGNIRQPRCIVCDAARPKKRKKKDATPEPTPVVEAPRPEAKPEPVVEAKPEPEPEPVVEAKAEASPASVKVPEPEAPKPKAPKKKRPKIATAADLSALFDEGGEENDASE